MPMTSSTSTASNDVGERTLAHLKAINARFIHNFITNDVVSHDDLLHPGFIAIRTSGARLGRAEFLEYWKTGFDPDVIVYWDTRDELITVVGDTALVRATNKHVIRENGRETTGFTAYTDTYVREDGRWRCLQAQLTTVAPGAEPGDDTIVSVYVRGVKQQPAA
jgi:ketosteroid isomerase-like protein